MNCPITFEPERIGIQVLVSLIMILGCDSEATNSTLDQSNDFDANASRTAQDMMVPISQLPTVIETSDGPIRGTSSEGLITYFGIPYAKAPVEEFRFAKPALPDEWTSPLLADRIVPGCPQPRSLIAQDTDEDCLYLNVWAPNNTEQKPVMVWIHGGGFYLGSGGPESYNGAALAREGGVVVVTLNYRLGLLGFLPIEDDEYDFMRILGLLDQQQALRWIQSEIEKFGGDPNNITIFGESAGGFSICHLLGMPSSDGLFHRAIIQSGGGCAPTTSAENASVGLVTALETAGCDVSSGESILSCMRTMPVDAITDLLDDLPQNGIGLTDVGPHRTNSIEQLGGYPRLRNTDEINIPIMTGSNAEEMKLFSQLGYFQVDNQIQFDALLEQITMDLELAPETLEIVRSMYNEATYGSHQNAAEALGTDLVFGCPSLKFSQISTEETPIFTYHFRLGLGGALSVAGATHGVEIAYLFGGDDTRLFGFPVDVDVELSRALRNVWASFARNGEPPTDLDWSASHLEGHPIMVFGEEWELGADRLKERCEFWIEHL